MKSKKLTEQEMIDLLINVLEELTDQYIEDNVIYDINVAGLWVFFDSFSYEYISDNEIKCHFFLNNEEINYSVSRALAEIYEE